jgi:hypothetical protein
VLAIAATLFRSFLTDKVVNGRPSESSPEKRRFIKPNHSNNINIYSLTLRLMSMEQQMTAA